LLSTEQIIPSVYGLLQDHLHWFVQLCILNMSWIPQQTINKLAQQVS